MRTLLRLLAATTLAVGAAHGVAEAAPQTPIGNLTSQLSQCAQVQSKVDILFLLDQSRSLGGPSGTDKGMVRRFATKDLARVLADFAKSAGVDARIEVSGFDGRFNRGQWRQLNEDSLAGINSDIDTVTDNDYEKLGPATDYWTALEGARRELASRPAERANACQLVVWFSDGDYDLDENGSFGTQLPYAPGIALGPSTKSQVIAKGKESICSKQQGPMNALRAKRVFIATVGLVTNQRLVFLENATTGSGGCGRPPEPGHAAYLEANQADTIGIEIAKLGSPSAVQESPYRKGEAALDFGLDKTVSTASVFAYAGPIDGPIQFGLSGPDGKIQWWNPQDSDGESVISGAKVGFYRGGGPESKSARFRMTADPSSPTWQGKWTVHFKTQNSIPSDALAQMVVNVTSDLKPVWKNPVADAESGAALPVQIEVQSSGGAVVTGDNPGIKASIAYVVDGGQTTLLKTDIPFDQLGQPQEVTLPATVGDGRLSLKLDITTQTTPPTSIVPAVKAWPLKIKAKGAYPSFRESTLVFPEAAGVEASRASVTVEGPGCVWLDQEQSLASVVSLPDGVGQIALGGAPSDRTGCQKLGAGETRVIDLTVTPNAEGNGSIVGQLSFWAMPEGPGEQQPYSIGFEADRSKAEDTPTKLLTLVIVTLLGLLVGAAPLFALRARLARILVRDQRSGQLQHIYKAFDIRDGRVTGPSGEDFSIQSHDVGPVTSSGQDSVKALDLNGVRFRARTFGNPFAVPDCEVRRSDGGELIASGGCSVTNRAQLPLALSGNWVAWHDGQSYKALYFLGVSEAIESLDQASQDFEAGLESVSHLLTGSSPTFSASVAPTTLDESYGASQYPSSGDIGAGSTWADTDPWASDDSPWQ